MKQNIAIAAVLGILCLSIQAADTPKDTVTAAAKALAAKPNYSWKTTVAVPEGTQFRPGPSEGQAEKDGFTVVKSTFRDNTMQIVIKGEKVAMTDPDGGWQTLSELENSEGPGRFMAMMARNYKAPAAQVQDLVAATQELKKDGDVYSGEMTEDGAKKLMSFRPRTDGEGPTISNAKGSTKFWIKDGLISKYEFKVKGNMSFNGNDREIDRTTTTEIKDVGATKVTVPEDAKKKLQ